MSKLRFNYGMRVKQVLLLLLLILIFVLFNNIFFNTLNRANDYFSQRILINEEKITPQKLFDKTWKIIYKDYYDPSLNHQDWVRWKNRYENKIKTEDDAKVAIDTIIASLNEPYTRFMSAKEFEDLIHSITSKIYGIGVSIHSKSGKIEVFNVIPSTPADFAGIKQGDIISAVNGKSTKGLNISEVATLVRGPENSIVEIEIIRDNKKILKKMTAGPIRGFLLGTGITAVIQSSSAITVMLVGLVNSGIMKLGQTIPVIMGSNVGTSATAWLLSLTGIDDSSNLLLSFLQPKNFTPILALIGVIMIMFIYF